MITQRKNSAHALVRSQGRWGFSLTELLVTSAIFSVLALVGIYTHIFGLRMNELIQTGSGTGAKANAYFEQMALEVRTAHRVQLGNGSASTFTETPSPTAQRGNAIQVYPTSNTNNFIRYWLDTPNDTLKRTLSTGATLPIVSGVSNDLVFAAEDFRGTQLPDHRYNRTIALSLDFYRLNGTGAGVGPGYLYDKFSVRLKMTRRALQ